MKDGGSADGNEADAGRQQVVSAEDGDPQNPNVTASQVEAGGSPTKVTPGAESTQNLNGTAGGQQVENAEADRTKSEDAQVSATVMKDGGSADGNEAEVAQVKYSDSNVTRDVDETGAGGDSDKVTQAKDGGNEADAGRQQVVSADGTQNLNAVKNKDPEDTPGGR